MSRHDICQFNHSINSDLLQLRKSGEHLFGAVAVKLHRHLKIPRPVHDGLDGCCGFEDFFESIVAHLDALSSHVRALEEKLKKMKDECDALKQAMLREVFE